MDVLYNFIFMPIASILLVFIKLFNKNIKNREHTCLKLLKNFKDDNTHKSKKIWLHAASMGEFEQAKPIIEMFKANHPGIKIYVSFFSPSGYENQKNYSYADYIFYLPIDKKANAIKFIDLIKPDLAVFIRYEIWYNYLNQLSKRNIPIYLINATKPQSRKLDFYYKKCLVLIDKIYTMNPNEIDYFRNEINHKAVFPLWDTRFDRISEKVEQNRLNPLFIKELFGSRLVFTAGSTWEPDEDIIIPAINKLNEKFNNLISLIIVPHQPTKEHISNLKFKLDNHVLLSEIENNQQAFIGNFKEKNPVIIVDSISKLLRIYANANIAYIGGAFGVGVHSVTEPVGYGVPVAVGPKYHNSPDAIVLEKITVLKSVNNADDLYNWLLRLIQNRELISYISNKAEKYVKTRCGSTAVIYKELFESMSRNK